MPRRPRCYQPGVVYSTTSRTRDARFLLRPSPAVNAIILNVIARALHLYPSVRLHYFVALSNHLHMLLSAGKGDELAGFLRFVNGFISHHILALHGVSSPLWDGRASVIPVVDEGAMIERYRYLLAHGCKEGLVATPAEWPGASAYPTLEGRELVGEWREGNRVTVHPIAIAPLPAWTDLSPAQRRRRQRQLVDAVIRDARAANRKLGRKPLGPAAVRAQDPFQTSVAPKRTPPPLCHASTAATRQAFRAVFRAFVAAYREAAAAMRAGIRDVVFPPGSFPTRGTWTPCDAVVAPFGRALVAPT